MKKQIRILGIDDGPFSFTDRYCPIIGVIMRGGSYVECILKSQVTVDGDEATSVCTNMILASKYHKQLKAIMIDGVAVGGFNIINRDALSKTTHLPVITITRDKPNFPKIKQALKKNFHDWETRYALIKQGTLYTMKTTHNPLSVQCTGISLEDAKEIIKLSTIRGVIPEPLQIAHLIASGITRGESYGKA